MNRNIVHKWNVVKNELRDYGNKLAISKIEEVQDKYAEAQVKINVMRKVLRRPSLNKC